MMKLTTKTMAAIMMASALVNGAAPAMVKADDSVIIMENCEAESVVEEVVEEEPVVEVVLEEESVVEEVVEEEPVVEMVVEEEPVVEEVLVEESVDEEDVTDLELEEIAFVEFVDKGYEKDEVDPEVESAVARVESNMKEATASNNHDTDCFANIFSSFSSEGMLMAAADTPVKTSEEKSEAEKKKEKDKEKKEREQEIYKAGTIAAQYAIELSRIDFDDEDATRQAALLTFKTLNETVIPEIPYVGGLISALVGITYAEDNKVVIKESEETKQLRKTNLLLTETIETIKNAAEKQINADKEQIKREDFAKMEEVASVLTNEYASLNPEFIAVMQDLNTMSNPPLEDAEAVFEKIYDRKASLNDRTYFSAYINFVDKVMHDTAFLPNVSGSNVFETYDYINSIDKEKKEIKYLFNDDRAVLTDKVENIVEVGYSTLRYCMEVELAKQNNMKAVNEKMLMDIDGENGRRSELQEQATSLKNDFDKLQEKYFDSKTTSKERKSIREAMASDNEQMTRINEEIKLLNTECEKISKTLSECNRAIARIESDTDILNEKKTLADEIISNQRDSICEGEDFMKNNSEQQEEIYVYVDSAEAVEFEFNGKSLLAYPKFNHGDTRVEYVDIFGNVWAHQDVTYEDREWPDELKEKGTYVFHYNGAAHRQDEGVRVIWWDKKEIGFYSYADWAYNKVDIHSLAGVKEYTIGEFKTEF